MGANVRVGIRWTIGDVTERGFEALRLSVTGVHRALGERAEYAVCVNTIPLARARALAGDLPRCVRWIPVTRADIPRFISDRLDASMALGMGWKFAPLRVFEHVPELSLDNDCILWNVPDPVRDWIERGDGECLMAGDVARCYGAYDAVCGPAAVNAGMRGIPPRFDLAAALEAALEGGPATLRADDEQGLQYAALSRWTRLRLVAVEDVTIVSPFPPHLQRLGRCGAHFVGVNAADLGWELDGRPASDLTAELWRALLPDVAARVGALNGSPEPESRASA